MSNKIIVLDTETTGLSCTDDEILQLSIIDNLGNVLLDEFYKPAHYDEWAEAEAINHISPANVADKPAITDDKQKICDILTNATVIIGYIIDFDLRFITAAIGWQPNYDEQAIIDLTAIFANLYGEYSKERGENKYQKLSVAADYFNYDWNKTFAHNSLSDCFATLHVAKGLNILRSSHG